MGKTTQYPSIWDERARTASLFASLVATVIVGIQGGMGRVTAGATTLSSIVFGSSLVFWCFFDARVNRIRLASSAWWLFFCAWPFAIPGYLLSTRGLRGIWITLRSIVIFVVVYVASAQIPHALISWRLGR